MSVDATNSFAVLKLSMDVGLAQDLYLIVCCVPPRQSNSISMATREIWEPLQHNVVAALTEGQVLIVGDLNARTGHLADFPASDTSDVHLQLGPSPTHAARRNQDAVVNVSGRRLLDLCCETGLRIVNGLLSALSGTLDTFRAERVTRVPRPI